MTITPLRTAVFFVLVSAFLATLSPAMADHKKRLHIPSELRGDGNVPSCDAPGVLKKVSKRFERVSVHYRDSTLKIEKVDDIRETDFIANPANQPDRRFCIGHAHLNNGKVPHVYYLIQEREGLASLTWGVDFCVEGLDFERAHGEKCRSLRQPF